MHREFKGIVARTESRFPLRGHPEGVASPNFFLFFFFFFLREIDKIRYSLAFSICPVYFSNAEKQIQRWNNIAIIKYYVAPRVPTYTVHCVYIVCVSNLKRLSDKSRNLKYYYKLVSSNDRNLAEKYCNTIRRYQTRCLSCDFACF